MDHRYNLAFIVFILAGLTDGLDGFLARILHQKSKIGAILDPIADKALLASSYITLAITGKVPNWLAVTVISRDLIIVFGVLVFLLFHTRVEIKPTVLSKVTTLIQLLTIFFVLAVLVGDLEMKALLHPMFALTVVVTVASGFHYIYLGFTMLNDQNGQQRG